jgi:phage head maturation protease
MTKRLGFEGKLYWGAAGSTASTELKIVRDVSYKLEATQADISDRNSIIDLVDVGGVKFSLEFEVNNQDSDGFVAAVRAAAIAGTAVAFRTRDKTSGWGVDGDFIVGTDESQPLRDAQRIKVTAAPTDKNGRVPTWS